ncbi:lysozyme inhibitor LprI family protein [Pseudomonas sp. JDS28PS106]|uniref:lysozyme inhibitor LprI family protein n=1 Tax=Pseudomonas sp. JDS28PS106 TaxID=2497235 RepID=UPI002FD73700
MRMTMTILAALMALGVGCSAQAQDCDASQASMNQCAAKELASLDARLNQQYKTQMAWLQSPAKKQALKDAQVKWIAFRDADCGYEAGNAGDGGSMWPLVQSNCLIKHTRVRVEQLENYVVCREEGCPR